MIFLKLFFEFFKIGLFTIGGGYAMIPLVREVVIKYGWISESAFYDFIGICESTPGPIAINMATYVGSTQAGILGAMCSTFGVVLPSLIIIILCCVVLEKVIKSDTFKKIINGIKPVVVGLIISTGIILILKSLGFQSIVSFNLNIISVVIFALICAIYFAFKYLLKKQIKTIPLIIIAAVLGIVINLIFK